MPESVPEQEEEQQCCAGPGVIDEDVNFELPDCHDGCLSPSPGRMHSREEAPMLRREEVERSVVVLCMIFMVGALVVVGLYYLRDIFVPFSVAWLLSHVLAWPCAVLVHWGSLFSKRCFSDYGLEGVVQLQDGPESLLGGSSSQMTLRSPRDRFSSSARTAIPVTIEDAGRQSCHVFAWWIRKTGWMMWRIVAVSLPVIGFLALGSLVIYWLAMSIQKPGLWDKYKNSPRISSLINWLEHNTDIRISVSEIITKLEGPIGDFVGGVVDFAEGSFLMVFMLCCFLVSNISSMSEEEEGNSTIKEITKDVNEAMRKFMLLKSLVSLIMALMVAAVLAIFKVDLTILFATITFILNFVPTIGGAIAVLFPIPLIFLDPAQPRMNVVYVPLLCILIHSFCGNVLEPIVFNVHLKIHMVVVLFALTFWLVVWGIVGAILSVPLTCAMKIALEKVRDRNAIPRPYADVVVCILDGRFPSRSRHPSMSESPIRQRRES